eukprot:365714-Chlamydomonas_euryale.AAC.5
MMVTKKYSSRCLPCCPLRKAALELYSGRGVGEQRAASPCCPLLAALGEAAEGWACGPAQ